MPWKLVATGPIYSPESSTLCELELTRLLVKLDLGKRPLGRPRRRWEDNVRIDYKKNRHRYEEIG